MKLDRALKENPYDENIGNESAYTRYLRYNVDGFYNKKSSEVRKIWKEFEKKQNKEE